MKKTLCLLTLLTALAGPVIAQPEVGGGYDRTAATDCTTETGGVTGECCLELDDNDLYCCESGPCTPGWVAYGGSGSGEINTASNLGGGLANWDTKSGVDLRFNTFAAVDFDLATNLISIDAAICRLASPALTGDPTAPTAAPGDDDTSIATSAHVQAAVNAAGGTDLTCSAGSCSVDNPVAAATALAADPVACGANQFANDTTAAGAVVCAQPAFTDLSGAATDAQVPNTITVDLATTATTANTGDSATAFFTSGEIADAQVSDTLTCSDLVAGSEVVSDAEVVDTLTASNYLPLAGGILTGETTVDDLGLEFTEGDTITDCSTFGATGGGIFFDDSEGIFKKCQDNVLTDLDTGGGGGISNVVEDTTPQLGGHLDVNGQDLGDGTLELLSFVETGSAVNEFTITNAAAGNGPTFSATGDDANIDINITPKGTGGVVIGGTPLVQGNGSAALHIDGNGQNTTIGDGGTNGIQVTDAGAVTVIGTGSITATAAAADTIDAASEIAQIIGSAEMADEDHGAVSWSSGVATVEDVACTGCVSVSDLAASLAFNATDLLDFSGIDASSATEGLILPQIASACAAATGEGQACWDTAGQDLYIGNGSAAVQMNTGSGITDVFDCTTGDCNGVTIETGESLFAAVGSRVEATEVLEAIDNDSGATLFECTAVYISGFDIPSNLPEADIADSDGAMMPAIGLVAADIANGATGMVIAAGVLENLDTSTGEGWSVGDDLYVNTSGTSADTDCGNTLTNVKPTGTALIQRIGEVGRVHGSNGEIFVFGAGRANDVPNIPSANFWVGNGSAVATAVAMSGDATMDNTGAVTVADDSHAHLITDVDVFTKAQLATQTSDVADYAEADGDTWTGVHDAGGATSFEVPNADGDVAVTADGMVAVDGAEDQFVVEMSGTGSEIGGEAAISPILKSSVTIDPGAHYDVDTQVFLTEIGDEAPNGITIDEWSISCNVDPDVEINANFKRATAFIGLGSAADIDAIDTTAGVATEDTDANINAGAVVANGQVLYLEFDADPEGTCVQMIFTFWYHAEED